MVKATIIGNAKPHINPVLFPVPIKVIRLNKPKNNKIVIVECNFTFKVMFRETVIIRKTRKKAERT